MQSISLESKSFQLFSTPNLFIEERDLNQDKNNWRVFHIYKHVMQSRT